MKAGVELRYYEMPLSVEQDASGWRVQLAGKGTQAEVRARQLIDCTASAAIAGMLGLERRREPSNQPGTLIYRIAGYEMYKLDLDALSAAAAEAVQAGQLDSTDFRHNLRGYLSIHAENATHITGADSSTSELHSQASIRGRASVVRMMRFLKRHSGFENLHLDQRQPEVGVRETYRIVGESTVTVGDYTSGRRFVDAIAHSF